MNVKREDFEIMAPVGSYESLQAAIQAGANSVYFGIEKLNMRSRSASNFSTEDLRKIVSICKENHIKSYLTVNTVIYNDDLELMKEIIETAKEVGVSAIIAADVAAMTYAYSIGVEVHLSTQLNIANVEALKFYARYADVVVLARECNMDQVRNIWEAIQEEQIKGPKGELIKIEMFCHGALCMAVSGKCYLSLHELNASANRGACYQVCRHGYRLTDDESDIEIKVDNQYLMSPKDLKTIHFINKLIESGVRVLKIEGRARGPEYVKTVVSCYDEAINSYLDGTYSEEKIAQWDERLKKVFNRGFWNGYYLGQRLGEWSSTYGSEATKKKVYVGKGMKYYSKLGVGEFLVETKYGIKKGDDILIIGPTTGVIELKVGEIHVGDSTAEKCEKGDLFSIAVPEKIRNSDKLYKWVDSSEIIKGE
ncbi:MAG: U32 family peptidase [Paludibacteraceae bacterium]|nr:U32 family peptidase [Paludibacteraceae bacterium]MBP5481096.1 U32 family peptidase [Paludibacteraceae bacterium]